MSEANQNQNDNNNNNNDSNNNDNKNDKNYDDLTEEQLEQEIQATQRRLQYLCARKWDRECKKEREMQQQKENQQQSEETQSQEFQQWQYFNPEHHRHHHHFGHFGPWQWKHQWDQECRGPCHKGPCHKCHCHKGPCQKNTQCPNKPNEKVDHGEKPQSCHRPHKRCFQCPPFFNPWWAYWQMGCHPCHEKSPEQMRDGHQERRQERWSPQDYWRYYYGYQGYESPQPPPQQQETAKDNNNNNNDNDNDNKKNEEQQIVEEEEEVAEVEQKDNSGYYGPDW